MNQKTAAVGIPIDSERSKTALIFHRRSQAEGRGFRSVIAEALARDIPVLVGINRLNQDAFLDFVDGFAAELVPELPVLEEWLKSAFTDGAAAA